MRRPVLSVILATVGVAGLTTAAATVAATLAALAHSGASGIVKQRMDHMGEIGKATKAIGRMMQDKAAWDPGAVRAHAAAISRAGGPAITELFPEGSIRGPSEARPEIWAEWARFERIAEDLSVRASALADGAGNARDGGPRSPEKLFGAMARTCKACHQHYRIKK